MKTTDLMSWNRRRIMPSKRSYIISNATGSQRNRGSSTFRSPVALFLFICVLTPLVFLETPSLPTNSLRWSSEILSTISKSSFPSSFLGIPPSSNSATGVAPPEDGIPVKSSPPTASLEPFDMQMTSLAKQGTWSSPCKPLCRASHKSPGIGEATFGEANHCPSGKTRSPLKL
ncbi:hypothetical protein Taro_036151 [Colocasia esculenta]|uniref:Uncharacterized protein n=1 Tax=Colocasia esculenta TaxID=4460 RepID=A0A843WCJ3_COLES|nr:hypothetical protein [Colocasia esculenta]